MADKPILLMEATKEQLESIEGIDSEMAATIVDARISQIIDLNFVYSITGIHLKTLKKFLIELGISFFCQLLHQEINDVKQDLNDVKQDINIVKTGLDEVKEKASEIDNVKETIESINIRMINVEKGQLTGSTIQFKNHIPTLALLKDDQHEKTVNQFNAIGGKFDSLAKDKNALAEAKFGTKPKMFSTPLSSTVLPHFSQVSPISKSLETASLDESYVMKGDKPEEQFASAISTLDLSLVPDTGKTEQQLTQVPSIPPAAVHNTEPAQPNNGLPFPSNVNQSQPGQLNIAQPPGPGQIAASASTINKQPASVPYAYASPDFAGQENTGFALQGTLSSSTTVSPVPVQPVFTLGNVSTGHNNPPFWSYNVPPPTVKPTTMPTTSTTAFHPGIPTERANMQMPSLQWATPVMPPGQVQSPSLIVNCNTTTANSVGSSSEKPRGRSRKRCQRESSSSSNESLDRESSRWKESHFTRERSRSPQPPKMPVFTGTSNLFWEAFIYQFERTTSRRNSDEGKKTCRFLDCLSEVALEYAHRSRISKYDELRKYMKRRFNKREEASAARRQVQYIRQTDAEMIEKFAERAHFLTMDGYYRRDNNIIDQIGTEAFLRGCQVKEAAKIVIEKIQGLSTRLSNG